MSVYFEDHKPAKKQWSYPRKDNDWGSNNPTGAIVVHTTESITDLILPDAGADNVARYIRDRVTFGSYHELIDSDSYIQMGRYEWQMYHEGTGGNRWSLGLAFCCKAKDWEFLPTWWVEGALTIGAQRARVMADWVASEYGIVVPAKHITPEEYRDGKPGFVGHGELDPDRRYDPGSKFDWDMFLGLYEETAFQEEEINLMDLSAQTNRMQDRLWALEAKTFITWAYQYHHNVTPSRDTIAADLAHAKVNGLSATRWRIANGM